MVVCSDGGVWYRQANLQVVERIIETYLISIMVVEEFAFLTHLCRKVTYLLVNI
ncbi:hypothetical protein H6G76_18770 [Nostoc sp. FACHB-152]|jgi:(2Fe-2S) ferredoxin|uniref:hypothetical protein n=1 Tax=unclassified Nostoc TaxID=2593658 RepID=UPI0016827D7F|nr:MULTISPECIES: hypothetical protein [unclassified Nostoc]MBD2449160.1 hypothetical protein [Nostoc sp. FACHB-152]MBD2470417.1 hypothetical protein [Nostoc sp. FACHB-145]